MNTEVSIILPNYNHSPYLKVRLESILNQTFQDFELIILDDFSTDDSIEVLEKYRSHHKVSHFIVNKENSGSPFKQWQKGLSLAKGNYIWIAESDDYCDLNFLESHLEILKDTETMVSVAKTIVVNHKGIYIKEASHSIFFSDTVGKTLTAESILKIPILNVSSICFKAEVMNQSESFFSKFNIIGDRVFYQEHFLNRYITKNTNTQSYFRRLDTAVSNFDSKPIDYKKRFFDENLKFITHEYRQKHVNKNLYNQYLTKFYQKVRNRTKKRDKLSFLYVLVYLKYKIYLKH